MNENSLCFITIASGMYCDYVSLYIYFITKAYPNDFVRVYIQEKESRKLFEQVNRIVHSDNWSIIFNYKMDYPRNVFTHQSLRFFIIDEITKSFPYNYIGDVDILIAKEKVPLVIQHQEHADFIGLPYSNTIRPKSKRLTGLHFVKSAEYYNRIQPYIKKYLRQLKINNTEYYRDDEILYALCNDAGMIPQKEADLGCSTEDHHYNTQTYNFRPHHGLHLRAFNGKNKIDDGAIMCKTSKAYRLYLERIKKYYNKDVANLVKELHPSIQLQMKRMLEC